MQICYRHGEAWAYLAEFCDKCFPSYTVPYPVTDFVDRVEPDTEKLKRRIFELEQALAFIHEKSKI